MKIRFCHALLMLLTAGTFSLAIPVQAETHRFVIQHGDGQLERQQAAMEKEEWDDTRSLRHKINARTEHNWDKDVAASDNQDRCEQSDNFNLYWESKTNRCLDRRTGRAVAP